MNVSENAVMEKPKLWDVNDVAQFLSVSRSWIYQRAEQGLLPHLRVGNLLRFEPDVLREFVRRDRVSATYAISRLARHSTSK
jgi:excisionase family DNA binding protein